MKVIYTKRFPPGRYVAINLFGVLFSKRPLTAAVIRHEYIHTAQMKELLYIGFYVWYVVEFIIRLIIAGNWHKAYRNVSFEKEAYAYQDVTGYLIIRHPYKWFVFYKQRKKDRL